MRETIKGRGMSSSFLCRAKIEGVKARFGVTNGSAGS
jgi:hypothetical protein